MRLLIIGLLLAPLTVNAWDTKGPAKPSPEAEKIVVDSVYRCLLQEIPELDDGTSDASTIAYAATFACGQEFEQLRRISSYTIRDRELRRRFVESPPIETRVLERNVALDLTLRYRAILKSGNKEDHYEIPADAANPYVQI